MAAIKVYTVRLPQEEAQRADLVARAEGISINDVFRTALQHYFDVKRTDEDFMRRARAMLARDSDIVEGLD
jgi:predicted HicB family RNase H-like nuclease